MVQLLRLRASNAGGVGSIPGQGTKIPQAAWCGQKKNIDREKFSSALKQQQQQKGCTSMMKHVFPWRRVRETVGKV